MRYPAARAAAASSCRAGRGNAESGYGNFHERDRLRSSSSRSRTMRALSSGDALAGIGVARPGVPAAGLDMLSPPMPDSVAETALDASSAGDGKSQCFKPAAALEYHVIDMNLVQAHTGRDRRVQRKPARLTVGAFDHGASAAAGKRCPQREARARGHRERTRGSRWLPGCFAKQVRTENHRQGIFRLPIHVRCRGPRPSPGAGRIAIAMSARRPRQR